MIKTSQKFTGFTLIEVVVAMAVLSIGILGLAVLQGTTLKAASSALYRSQATSLAYSIIDAMRANRTNALAGNYDTAVATTPPACTSVTLSGTIAVQDVAAWQNALACTLPSGTGSIARAGTASPNNSIITITIQWDDSRSKGGVANQQFATTTNL